MRVYIIFIYLLLSSFTRLTYGNEPCILAPKGLAALKRPVSILSWTELRDRFTEILEELNNPENPHYSPDNDEIQAASDLLSSEIYQARFRYPIYLTDTHISNIKDFQSYLEKTRHIVWDTMHPEKRQTFLKIIEGLQKYLPGFLKRRYPEINIKSINIGGSLAEFWSAYPASASMPFGEDIDVMIVTDSILPGEQGIPLDSLAEGQELSEEILPQNAVYGIKTLDLIIGHEENIKSGHPDVVTIYGSCLTIYGQTVSISHGITDDFTVLSRIITLTGERVWRFPGRLTVAHWLIKCLAEKLNIHIAECDMDDINTNKERAFKVIKANLTRIFIHLALQKLNTIISKDTPSTEPLLLSA